MDFKIQFAKAYHECKTKAIKKQSICFHPDCSEKSINSHILQKNGVLSEIAQDNHVVGMHINKFLEKEHDFKRIGINEAFSFNCFCSAHDRDLFKAIEKKDVDFSEYRNLILFTLRTIYNEKFRKLVNIEMYSCLIKNHSDKFNLRRLERLIDNETLGLKDIELTENEIWRDIKTGSQSYVFKTREISRKAICLSAFYNYETTKELENYLKVNGNHKEEVTDIFINLFPYKGKSVLMMSYKKKNENVVKGYFNEFFSDNEKRLERKITNLMMFQCETWVVSPQFFKSNIEKNKEAFSFAVDFSLNNMNERRFFDLNIFRTDFSDKFRVFKNRASQYLR